MFGLIPKDEKFFQLFKEMTENIFGDLDWNWFPILATLYFKSLEEDIFCSRIPIVIEAIMEMNVTCSCTKFRNSFPTR